MLNVIEKLSSGSFVMFIYNMIFITSVAGMTFLLDITKTKTSRTSLELFSPFTASVVRK